ALEAGGSPRSTLVYILQRVSEGSRTLASWFTARRAATATPRKPYWAARAEVGRPMLLVEVRHAGDRPSERRRFGLCIAHNAMPDVEVDRLVVRVRNGSSHIRLVAAFRAEQPLDAVRLAAWTNQLTIAAGQLADVHHRSRQEKPLSLAHISSRLPAVAAVPNPLPLLFAKYDLRLERLHGAAHGRAPLAKRQRCDKPVLLVVAAKVTTADWQSPSRNVQHQVPKARPHIKHVG